MKGVETFENRFKLQTENIDSLAHEIHINIDAIAKEAKTSNAGYIDGSLVGIHTTLGERFMMEEKSVIGLIGEFRKFAEKWM